MDWQEELITVYEYICQQFCQGLWAYTQRFSNNVRPDFTDQEVLTIYLYGLLKGHSKLRALYDYTRDHLGDWFPRLPSYQGYVHRLNRCGKAFEVLTESLLERTPSADVLFSCRLVDSLPIMLAVHKRSDMYRKKWTVAQPNFFISKAAGAR
jgi:hypothetical protein